jgi:hypothetical protein
MRPITTIPLVGLMIMTGLSFSISGNNSVKNLAVSANGFAIVELFTSEGCSSCPPADELAIKLSKEYSSNVYFLSFHVDYWNDLGWKDKFSKADFTQRQRKYAALFNLKSIYTPQVVVNGKKEFVGSGENWLRRTIIEELNEKSLSDLSVAAKSNGNIISVSYKMQLSNNYILNVALVQLNAETAVKKGENTGRRLRHLNVVRDFQTISANQTAEGNLEFKIPEDLPSGEMKVIAFLQNKTSLKIIGVAESLIP